MRRWHRRHIHPSVPRYPRQTVDIVNEQIQRRRRNSADVVHRASLVEVRPRFHPPCAGWSPMVFTAFRDSRPWSCPWPPPLHGNRCIRLRALNIRTSWPCSTTELLATSACGSRCAGSPAATRVPPSGQRRGRTHCSGGGADTARPSTPVPARTAAPPRTGLPAGRSRAGAPAAPAAAGPRSRCRRCRRRRTPRSGCGRPGSATRTSCCVGGCPVPVSRTIRTCRIGRWYWAEL